MPCRSSLLLVVLMIGGLVRADGPADNVAASTRPIPPKGITIPETDRGRLEEGARALSTEIDDLRRLQKDKPRLLELLPDVQIYEKAVRTALQYNEFFNVRELAAAQKLLDQGRERAVQLRAGSSPWNTATGLVARGYVSAIDGSVQPYGLVVPASYQPNRPGRLRLDVWCHGRGETLSELNFIKERQTSTGEFAPADAFVLHPYGRYCNANKFAGEIDLFEALENVKRHYPVDQDRLVMRGFSMGGAACWQFAVHYPGVWAAAAPGTGFAETPEFLRVFQNERVKPTWYEQKLWHLYDCTDYAINLFNCPTVAYSGQRDRQKQAADMMAKALAAEGIELVHVIGAGAGHQYTPAAKVEIDRRIDAIVALGRNALPTEIHFTTWTLRYNQCHWLILDGLEKHWERARVDADFRGDGQRGARISTSNVSAFTISIPPGGSAAVPIPAPPTPLQIDSQPVQTPPTRSDRSWIAQFRKSNGNWALVASPEFATLHKRHGLQGPIDDAFMDSFLMVRPTGTALSQKIGNWTKTEMQHALDHWRRVFRGDARVADDKDVGTAEIAAYNLILWGDPQSNSILKRISDKLPVHWDAEHVRLGEQSFDAGHHVPVLVYPNPLDPRRYVVVNSGFTFREYDYLNNARQVPKLPDFAVVDIDVPVSARAPGGIVAAGFFNEDWRLDATHSSGPGQ